MSRPATSAQSVPSGSQATLLADYRTVLTVSGLQCPWPREAVWRSEETGELGASVPLEAVAPIRSWEGDFGSLPTLAEYADMVIRLRIGEVNLGGLATVPRQAPLTARLAKLEYDAAAGPEGVALYEAQADESLAIYLDPGSYSHPNQCPGLLPVLRTKHRAGSSQEPLLRLSQARHPQLPRSSPAHKKTVHEAKAYRPSREKALCSPRKRTKQFKEVETAEKRARQNLCFEPGHSSVRVGPTPKSRDPLHCLFRQRKSVHPFSRLAGVIPKLWLTSEQWARKNPRKQLKTKHLGDSVSFRVFR
jgi:hypothetical protein